MTSKERVRAAYERKAVDKIPAAFESTGRVKENLMKHYGFTDYDQLLDKFDIDIIYASPRFIGPARVDRYDEKGNHVKSDIWGIERTSHETANDFYYFSTYHPLSGVETFEDLEKYTFPDPDWFDYSAITETCEKYPDKAIMIGHEGPFQIVTEMMGMDEFFILMLEEPELAQTILDKINAFEMEYYKRQLEAGGGKVDALRTHDDYGTQISTLFSMDLWRKFFKANTKKLVDLAHEHGAFFQQHSCGAVAPIIPELLDCGVDALEPVQKVEGLEVERLAELYGGKLTFHGGIDTQGLLPNGTVDEVKAETTKFMRMLGESNSYILMASQGFEPDVPFENIEAVYSVPRDSLTK